MHDRLFLQYQPHRPSRHTQRGSLLWTNVRHRHRLLSMCQHVIWVDQYWTALRLPIDQPRLTFDTRPCLFILWKIIYSTSRFTENVHTNMKFLLCLAILSRPHDRLVTLSLRTNDSEQDRHAKSNGISGLYSSSRRWGIISFNFSRVLSSSRNDRCFCER